MPALRGGIQERDGYFNALFHLFISDKNELQIAAYNFRKHTIFVNFSQLNPFCKDKFSQILSFQ